MTDYPAITADLLRADPFRMNCLRAARQLGLTDYYLAAGFLRNAIWDHLHHKTVMTALNDIDLVYFDASDTSTSTELRLCSALQHLLPTEHWEVRNQARMHLYHGHPSYQHTAEGISHWVEMATCVGVRLEHDDSFSFCAPYGLKENWSLQLRINPKNPRYELFSTRIEQKNWLRIWPQLQLVETE
jgi:hypothetical protein